MKQERIKKSRSKFSSVSLQVTPTVDKRRGQSLSNGHAKEVLEDINSR